MPVSKIRFIYWFAYHNLYASSVRYRGKYPLEYARENPGIGSYFITPGYSPKDIFKFIKAYISALLFRKKDSIIVIQRVQSSFIYANLLKILVWIRHHNTVYDLDDADYLTNDPTTIYDLAGRCAFVSAGSREIAEHLRPFNPNTFHITSPVYDLGLVKTKRSTPFTIGWIGSFGPGHRDSLYRFVFPAVKDLPFPCRLVVVGIIEQPDLERIRHYFDGCRDLELHIPLDLDWNNEEDLQRRILEFDVGIATLLDTPEQLAKSGIKAKQYMNNGVPVLSNNLPENNMVVKHGKNGFLCDSPGEFRERIIQFRNMADEEYSKFSLNARNSIVNFDYRKYFGDFEKMINNGVGRRA